MKILSFTLGFFLSLSAWAKSDYPLVISSTGKAFVTEVDGKKNPVKAKALLRGKAHFQTSAGAMVRIQWDAQRELTIMENTDLSIPAIAWETGEAPLLVLKSGAIRWHSKEAGYQVALRSDLYEFIAPNADFILSMQPDQAKAVLKVLKGKMNFSAMNAEESVSVGAGYQVAFQGVLEEGAIAYDILLMGKKIPRGRLTAVTEMDQGEYAAFLDAEKMIQKNADMQKAKAKAVVEQKKRTGVICSEPDAKLNECVWTCEGNPKSEKKVCAVSKKGVQCVRKRCNANGEWAEAVALEGVKAESLCKVKPVVAPCDY